MIWKILAIAFAAISAVLLVLLMKNSIDQKPLHDPRLLGEWVSDKERTLDNFPKHMSESQKEKLAPLFGKLRISYTPTTYTTEYDGDTETVPYTVLGIDKYSVVIQSEGASNPDVAFLEMSSFSKIQFDGDDSYWVITAFGGLTEYFRRVDAKAK